MPFNLNADLGEAGRLRKFALAGGFRNTGLAIQSKLNSPANENTHFANGSRYLDSSLSVRSRANRRTSRNYWP